MLKADEIIEIMNKWAPEELIDSWDNTGLQIGDRDKEINKILIGLDLDREIFNKAIKENYDMIITHHPIIFKPLKKITNDNYNEELIIDIIKNNLVAYNAHSNLDLALGGVNDKLAKILGIRNTKPLAILDNQRENIGYGRIGEIDKVSLKSFLQKIKEELQIENLIVYGDMDKNVQKVAVAGGSGSGFIEDAYKNKADLYITGDIKYHDSQLAYNLGLTLVDGGHFHTEKIILPEIKRYLEDNLNNDVEIKVVMEPSIPQNIL